MPCVFSGDYHDQIWGTPVLDSRGLFQQLSLCTQQCGVSWKIVWNKRLHYREAFHDWDMRAVARMTEEDLDALCDKEGPWAGRLLQNRKKLSAIVHNARMMVQIDEATSGGLAAYLWRFVASPSEAGIFEVQLAGLPSPLRVQAQYVNAAEEPSSAAYAETFKETSALSDRLAAALKRKGDAAAPCAQPFQFLGSVTLQAFLLQCGLLNGHAPSCPKNPRGGAPGKSRVCKRARDNDEPPRTSSKRRARADEPPRTSKRRARAGARAGTSSPPAAADDDDVWL